MELTVNTSGDTTRVQVIGDIDEQGANRLKAAFNSLQLTGQKTLAFDFGQVNHIGSAGLGKLLLFYQKLTTMGLAMRIENTSPDLRQILAELRLDTLFQVN